MTILAAVNLALLGWIVAEQRIMRRDIGDLRERMARLEGLFDGFTKGDPAR